MSFARCPISDVSRLLPSRRIFRESRKKRPSESHNADAVSRLSSSRCRAGESPTGSRSRCDTWDKALSSPVMHNLGAVSAGRQAAHSLLRDVRPRRPLAFQRRSPSSSITTPRDNGELPWLPTETLRGRPAGRLRQLHTFQDGPVSSEAHFGARDGEAALGRRFYSHRTTFRPVTTRARLPGLLRADTNKDASLRATVALRERVDDVLDAFGLSTTSGVSGPRR